MKKLLIQKIFKLLPLCTLIFASIACRFPDVGKMVGEFFREDTKFIEGLFGPARTSSFDEDDVEYIQSLSGDDLNEFVNNMSADELEEFVDSLTSEELEEFIKMLPVDKQAELEKPDEADLGNLANMVGTYYGDGPITPNDWDAIEKEYSIVVAEDGSVSGRFIHIYEMYTYFQSANCQKYNLVSTVTEINGQITEVINNSKAIGVATLDKTHYRIIDDTDCGQDLIYNSDDAIMEGYRITIIGDMIELSPGEGTSGNVLRAKKQ